MTIRSDREPRCRYVSLKVFNVLSVLEMTISKI